MTAKKWIADDRRGEVIFYFALAVFLATLFVDRTELLVTMDPLTRKAVQIVRYGSVCLIALKVFCSVALPRGFVLAGMGALCITLLCFLSSKQRGIVYTVIVALGAYQCEKRRVFQIFTGVFFAGTVITILLAKAGVFHDYILDTARNRHNLGFNWVTLPSIYALFISIGYCNIRKDRIRLLEIALLEAFALVLFILTDTRLSFLINSAFLFTVLIQKYVYRNDWKMLRVVNAKICLLPFVLFAAALVIQLMYSPDKEIWKTIDRLLSERLSFTAPNMKNLPLTLFGQAIEWHGLSLGENILKNTGVPYNNVDCSYLRLLFDYGIVGILTSLCIYAVGLWKAVREGDGLLVFSYTIVLLFCLTEQWMMELAFNPFALIAMCRCGTGQDKGWNPWARKILFHREKCIGEC